MCRYVVRKDPELNAVYVSLNYFSSDKLRDTFVCNELNWFGSRPPREVLPDDARDTIAGERDKSVGRMEQGTDDDHHLHLSAASSSECGVGEAPLLVKVRHGPNAYACKRFELRDGGRAAIVQLPANDQGLAAGQFAVFYQGGVCLGGGVICEAATG
jgi:tRNA-5-taurinomethyluridine 2-sulfurtransferase